MKRHRVIRQNRHVAMMCFQTTSYCPTSAYTFPAPNCTYCIQHSDCFDAWNVASGIVWRALNHSVYFDDSLRVTSRLLASGFLRKQRVCYSNVALLRCRWTTDVNISKIHISIDRIRKQSNSEWLFSQVDLQVGQKSEPLSRIIMKSY